MLRMRIALKVIWSRLHETSVSHFSARIPRVEKKVLMAVLKKGVAMSR